MRAEMYSGEIGWSERAAWVAADGIPAGEWYALTGAFEAETGKTVLLFCAMEGAQIRINGELIHRFVTRSYIFDKAWEALDISDCVRPGHNEIEVLTRRGERGDILFEIVCGGRRFASGDGDFALRARPYARLKKGISYMVGGSDAEEYDTALPRLGEECAVIVTGPRLHGPVRRMHRVYALPESGERLPAQAVCMAVRAETAPGFAGRLSGDGGAAVYYAVLRCEGPESLCLYPGGGVLACALDGFALSAGEAAPLLSGTHLLAVAGREPEIEAYTSAAISPWMYCPVPDAPQSRPVVYPWNDDREERTLTPGAESLLRASAIPDIARPAGAKGRPLQRIVTAPDAVMPARALPPRPERRTDRVGIRTKRDTAVIDPSPLYTKLVFDFGEERLGYSGWTLETKERLRLRADLFEIIDENGFRMMGERNRVVYSSVPGGQTYTVHCRRGGRYLLVTLPPNREQITLSVFMENAAYPVNDMAEFSCDDELLNEVYRMCLRTARVCMADLYMDCPGHEQNVWVGDARVTAQVNLNCFGDYAYNARFLRLIAQSMDDELTPNHRAGSWRYLERRFLPCACFPTYPSGNIAVWSWQWVLAVADAYEHTGDTRLLSDLLPVIEETLRRAIGWYSPRGLLNIEGTWNLVDWADNDLKEYGEVSVNNMMLCACFDKAAVMEKVLGRDEEAAKWRQAAEELRGNINRWCWDEEMGMYADTVRDETAYDGYRAYCAHSRREPDEAARRTPVSYAEFRKMRRVSVQTAVFALLYDIARGERKAICERLLTDNIEKGDYKPGTPANPRRALSKDPVRIGSPFFMFFALEALYKTGHADLAELAMRRDWGGMLEAGINTCTETFNAPGRILTRSAAHAWSTSPAIAMTRRTLGVIPLAPGFTAFTVRPEAATVSRASGSVCTPYGKIFVRWERREDGGMIIECDAPKECRHIKKTRED